MTVRQIALELVRKLRAAGFDAFWVGGCVRDLLLGRTPEDYDIATSATPSQVESLFAKTIPVGKQFGVLLVVEQNQTFQVATFRAESDYRDGRRPSRVSFCDAMADARRRDFTVNGLFYDPLAEQVHDWVEGQADLRARLIRTIGPPEERFAEDHLRLLRAARFAAQLDFTLDAATLAALRANAAGIAKVSAERVRDELIKLFGPPHAARGLELLRITQLLGHILPEVEATIHCRQSPGFHPEGSVYQHYLLMLGQLPQPAPPELPWAVLLHDIAKPVTFSEEPGTGVIHFYGHEKIGAQMAVQILTRLRFPRKQIDDIAASVYYHMQFKDVRGMRQSTVRRMLLRPTFPLELELHRLDCLGSHGRLDNYHFLLDAQAALARQPNLIPPLLRGHDLIALGLKPGPALGAMLAQVREKQLQEELQSREQALSWVRSQLPGGPGAER